MGKKSGLKMWKWPGPAAIVC